MSASLRGALEGVLRHGTFPLLAFGPGALVLGLQGGDAALGAAPSTLVLAVGVALVVGAYLLLAALERFLPHRDAWNQPHDDVRADVLYLLLVGPASAITGAVLARTVAGLAPEAARFASWPAHWPVAVQLLLACVLAEFGHYVLHRLGHEVPLLWRLHAIHHSARRLYWLNATRFHPLDLLALGFLQALPLEWLGIPPGIYFAYFVASSCYGQLQHCNVDVDTRIFRWVFATPELHRWHHSQHPAEGNTNYGAILILWDQLFRTRFWPGHPIAEDVGIGDMPSFPTRLRDQLAAPFRWAEVVRASGPGDAPLQAKNTK